MGYVISIVNMKGGVGKTTLTVNLAACLAKDHRMRVLVVDLDTQINATLSLIPPLHFAKLKKENRTLKQLINHVVQPSVRVSLPLHEIIQSNVCQVKGLDLLPGDLENYNDFLIATLLLSQSKGDQQDFEKRWHQLEDSLITTVLQSLIPRYDFILLDFPPGDYLLTRSGLIASDFYIIPAKPEPLSVVGMGMLEGRIEKLKQANRAAITLIGIIFYSLGHATSMAPKIKHRVADEFGADTIFTTEIPRNVAVAKAVDEFQPVVLTEPTAPGAKAFTEFTQEFLQKLSNTLATLPAKLKEV